ncbi:natterin-3-like [Scomber scombrus]|uniref:natterin-3-like n=1 Tax=Scomber scombrus TaxID=13677 RepID=UPI002DD9BA94|nr:natterin-3-like [Scomber scombrus]
MALYKVICVAALLTLLAAESRSQPNVSILDPPPEDRTTDITSDRTMLTDEFTLSSPTLRQKRAASYYNPIPNSNLRWVYRSSGSRLPAGTVYYDNGYTHRRDYICHCRCAAGFHAAGSNTCKYAYGFKEHTCTKFYLLVNKDNFEIFEFKSGSYGSVPKDAIRTCRNVNIFVGKNEYGLGKVDVRNKSFYLPWEGWEYKYRHYHVLVMSRRVKSDRISDVKYNFKAAKKISHPPEVMTKASSSNYQCRTVSKTVHLSKSYSEEKRWDSTTSISVGVTASFTGKIPFVGETGIEVSASVTKDISKGSSISVSKNLAVDVSVTVPPNHSCGVKIMGHRYTTKIPYTARLTRTYKNGKVKSTTTTGTFNGVNVVDFRSVVDRCVPLPNAQPCK